MKCPKCSMNNPASARFCVRCGAVLGKPKKKSLRRRFGSLLVNTMIIGVTLVGIGMVIAGTDALLPRAGSAHVEDEIAYNETDNYMAQDAPYAYAPEGEDAPASAPQNDEPAVVQEDIVNEDQDHAPLENDIKTENEAAKEETPRIVGETKNDGTGFANRQPIDPDQIYSERNSEIKRPGSGVVLNLLDYENIRLSDYKENPMFVLEGESDDGLLISVSISRVDVMPQTRSEAIDTSDSGLYSRIGGQEDLYYYIYRPAGLTANGSIVDCQNGWITQISITDLNDSREENDAFSKNAYKALVNLFNDFEG